MHVPPVRGMQSTQPSQKGCALGCSILITVFILIPWMIFSRAKHDVQEAIMASQMNDDDIEFVVLYEDDSVVAPWVIRPKTPAEQCELGRVVAEVNQVGKLHVVTNRLPSPFSTPRYVWVSKGDESGTRTMVYGVFSNLPAAIAWMKREGYERSSPSDDDTFRLLSLKRDDQEWDAGHIALANVPSWSKETGEAVQRQMDIGIFTAKYNIWGSRVYERATDTDIYNAYRQVPREN